eukprot:scaffold81291_cov51-Phaeocystis_antarctica.AAC.1
MSKPAHLTATLHLASTWGDLASSPLQPHPVEHSTSQRQHKRLASLVNDSGSPGDCATPGHLTAPRDRRSGYLIEIGGTHRSYWPSIVVGASFQLASWKFSVKGALAGAATNADAGHPVPIGQYNVPVMPPSSPPTTPPPPS